MHSRERRNGRSGVLDPEAETAAPEEARTDPGFRSEKIDARAEHRSPAPSTPSPGGGASDPFTAALAELDGVDVTRRAPARVPSWEKRRRASVPPASGRGRLRLPLPAGPAPSEGGSTRARIDDPLDAGSPPIAEATGETGRLAQERNTREARAEAAEEGGASVQFSATDLLEKLKDAPRSSAPRRRSVHVVHEYREVVVTGLVGIMLIAAAITYHAIGRERTAPPTPVAPNRATVAPFAPSQPSPKPSTGAGLEASPSKLSETGSPRGPSSPVENATPARRGSRGERNDPAASLPAETEGARKTATPLVSVVSTPKGAIVEIDGVIYGSTPLIMPSPPNTDRMKIGLKLDKFKRWEQIVTAGASGHFSVNVTLEPIR